MDDLGGVGVAGEICACDAMEEVHDNVTGLQVLVILGWVRTLFVCRGGRKNSDINSDKTFQTEQVVRGTDPGDDVGSDTSSDPDDDEIRTVAEGVESDSTL